jgi:hypothetical protein
VAPAWPRVESRRLERGTGWTLLVVAVLFAMLWLSVLVPYAVGGPSPEPDGVGGTAYPVFVLDLVVAIVVTGETWQMGAGAGPSLVMLAVSGWLAVRWLRSLRPEERAFLRPSPWDGSR